MDIDYQHPSTDAMVRRLRRDLRIWRAWAIIATALLGAAVVALHMTADLHCLRWFFDNSGHTY